MAEEVANKQLSLKDYNKVRKEALKALKEQENKIEQMRDPLYSVDFQLEKRYPGITTIRAAVHGDLLKKLKEFDKGDFSTIMTPSYDKDVIDYTAEVYNALENVLTNAESYSNIISKSPLMFLYKQNGDLSFKQNLFGVQAGGQMASGMSAIDVFTAMYIQKKSFMDYSKKNPSKAKSLEELYKYSEDVQTRQMTLKKKKLQFSDRFESSKKGNKAEKVIKYFKLLGSTALFISDSKNTLSKMFKPVLRTGIGAILTFKAFPSTILTTPRFFLKAEYDNNENFIGSFTSSKTGLRFSTKDIIPDPYYDAPKGKIYVAIERTLSHVVCREIPNKFIANIEKEENKVGSKMEVES